LRYRRGNPDWEKKGPEAKSEEIGKGVAVKSGPQDISCTESWESRLRGLSREGGPGIKRLNKVDRSSLACTGDLKKPGSRGVPSLKLKGIETGL